MSNRGRVPRRLSRGDVDPATPVALWFLLTAPGEQSASLREYARAFCADTDNTRLVDVEGSGNYPGFSHVYIVVDGGDIAGAVQGDARAVDAVATARTLVGRLFMFDPVLVPEPAGQQSA